MRAHLPLHRTRSSRQESFRDVASAAAVALAAAALYAATRQSWLGGDGPALVARLARASAEGGVPLWMHVLYLPLGRLVTAVTPVGDPAVALALVSAAAGGVAVGSAFLLARLLGASRPAAGFAAAVLATAPAQWSFSTSVEVHALHGAAVGACACATLLAPWRSPVRATVLSSALFPLVFLSHRSGVLLLFAWVLLAWIARARVARPFTARETVLLVALPHAAALALAVAAVDRLGPPDAGVAWTLELLGRLGHTPRAGFLWAGFAGPLWLLLLLSAAGLARPVTTRAERAAALFLVLPTLLFFLLFVGDPNGGGYFLGVAPLLAAFAARALARPAPRALVASAAVLLALQAGGSLRIVELGRGTDVRTARAEVVRAALPSGGTLLSMDPWLQTVEGACPGVREVNLWQPVFAAHESGLSDREIDALVERLVRSLLADGRGPVAFDASYVARRERAPELAAHADRIGEIVERMGGEIVPGTDAPPLRRDETAPEG